MPRATGSPASPPDGNPNVPVVPGGASRQPRRPFQSKTSESKARSAPSHKNNDSEPTNAVGRIQVETASGRRATLKPNQPAEQSDLRQDGERSQGLTNSPEVIPSDLEVDTRFETSVTTTTTQVIDVQQTEHSTSARGDTSQPHRTLSISYAGLQRKPSFLREARVPTASSTSMTDALYLPPSSGTVSTFGVEESLFEIQHLHRQETDHILNIMKVRLKENAEYKIFRDEELRIIQAENEQLLRHVSTLKSNVALLEIKLSSHDGSPTGDASAQERMGLAVTTTIITVATTINTVTTQIERWRDAVVKNKGSITISAAELENLLSNLSNTFSQMTALQEQYTTPLKELGSVRRELQGILSLHKQKDETIASLTAEVAQLKIADAMKAQKFDALARENQTVSKDPSTTSARLAKLQHNCDAPSRKLDSALQQLQSKEALIGEQNSKISSFATEVFQMKQCNTELTTKLASLRQEYEIKESLQVVELRKQNDAQSKDLVSVRNELRESAALVGKRDQTIADLRAEVGRLKQVDVHKTEELQGERRCKEELQHTVSTLTSDIAHLQRRCEAQSEGNLSIRGDLRAKESLLVENEQTITSLSTERDHAMHEKSVISDSLSTSRRDAEQLQQKLSDARDENTNLQNQYDAQSRELNALRAEHERLKVLGPGGNFTDGDVIEHITRALEDKEKQIKELGQRLATATSRNNDFEKSVEELDRKLSVLNDELAAKTSQYERTSKSLTVQVEQLQTADIAKSDQLATALDRGRELELEVSTVTHQFTDLQVRFTSQSKELSSASTRLQTMSSSIQEKNKEISSLSSERERLVSASAAQGKQIAELQRDVTATASQLTELQGRWKEQASELDSVKGKLAISVSSIEDKDRRVTALSDEIAVLKRTSDEHLAAARKEVDVLQRDLTNSRAQITVLQKENQMQLIELESLRNQVTGEDGIAALTAQIEKLKTLCSTRAKELTTAGKNLDQLRHELKSSSARTTELKQELDSQIASNQQTTAELITARADLERLHGDLSTSSAQIKGYQTQSEELNAKIRKLEQSDTAQQDELTAARAELKQLHGDLSASSTQIAGYMVQLTELRSQVEQLKLSRDAKAEELQVVVATKKLERFQRSAEESSSQITQLQRRYENQSAKLKFFEEQVAGAMPGGDSTVDSEEWKRTQAIILSEVKDYTAVIQLTAKVDEWLHDDAKRAEALTLELEKRNKENEELRHKLVTLKEIYTRAPRIKQIFQSETIEIRRREVEGTETTKRHEEETNALKTALAESQSQLRGVQRVIATADTYADEMIIQVLKKLNAEVQQNTTLMAEGLAESFQSRTANATREQASAMQNIQKIIGQPLAAGLANMTADDAALYLSIALQAFFSYYLCHLISSWTIEKGHNEFISAIYEQLQKAETQPMSGRWRALTRAYISSSWISNPNSLTTPILGALSDIVVVAGCAASASAAKSKLWSFKDKVQSIIAIAGQFSKMIGEVVSADFGVTAPGPRLEFEDTMMEEDDMDDGQGQASGMAAGQKVLCATHLGMTKRMQRETGKEALTVIKAKVVLESFLDT